MKTYTVKDHEFVTPFKADTVEEAAKKALHVLGFEYGAKNMIKLHGAVVTLKELGYELEVVLNG